MQAISEEGDEDMRLDPMLDLMIDRPQLEIVFQVFERSFDFGQLNVELPEIGGIAISEIGAQQIAPFTSAHLAQLLAVDLVILQRIVVNANRIGDLEYAEMAQARIDYLNSGMRDELRTEFRRIMRVYEEFLTEKNDRTTRATSTWRRVENKGEKQTMIDWARSKSPAEGFTALVKVGKIEDTAEYLIISPPMWSNWRSAGLTERTEFKLKGTYLR